MDTGRSCQPASAIIAQAEYDAFKIFRQVLEGRAGVSGVEEEYPMWDMPCYGNCMFVACGTTTPGL